MPVSTRAILNSFNNLQVLFPSIGLVLPLSTPQFQRTLFTSSKNACTFLSAGTLQKQFPLPSTYVFAYPTAS
jgi:hypothetical protein